MNSKMKMRFMAMPVALGLLAAPLVACDKLQDGLDTLCCKDFTPGASLIDVDWEIEGEAGVTFSAFMQASADFTGSASAMVNDVSGACMQIALDLGADPKAVTESDPAKRASAWCAEAVAQIGKAGVKGKIQISVQPPVCTFNVSAQASCEASCTANASCEAELGNIEARCSPGELSGKCSGECSGSCEGSANLAVSCEGTCSGTCEGTCNGNTMSGGKCDGKCEGKCRGSCKAEAGASVNCEGQCTGGCDVKVTAPKCTGKLTPPSASCEANASCSGSCEASASAKATCSDPSVEITGEAGLSAVIGTLKVNLPKLFAVAQVRGELLVKNAEFLVSAGADFSGQAEGDFSVKAGACIVPVVLSLGQSLENVQAGLAGSISVVGSVQ